MLHVYRGIMRLPVAIIALLLFSVAGLSAQAGDTVQMPDPPEGFSWQALPEIKAAFLLPANWHYLAEERDGTKAYFLTKQDIASDGMFTTGLSINVVSNVPKRANVTAELYAEALAASVAELPGAEIQDSWSRVEGPFHSYGVRYRTPKPDGSFLIIHQLNVGNAKTGTLYILIFEAPEAEWEEAWSSGEAIMRAFSLDQGI